MRALEYMRDLIAKMEDVGMTETDSFLIHAIEGQPAIVHQMSGRYTYIWREQANSLGSSQLVKVGSIDNMEQID